MSEQGIPHAHQEVLASFGGRRVMIESPLLKKIVAESKAKSRQESIVLFLEGRFGEVPQDIIKRLRRFRGEKRLKALIKYSVSCPNLETFRTRLFS
jgi:hypothetical protein